MFIGVYLLSPVLLKYRLEPKLIISLRSSFNENYFRSLLSWSLSRPMSVDYVYVGVSPFLSVLLEMRIPFIALPPVFQLSLFRPLFLPQYSFFNCALVFISPCHLIFFLTFTEFPLQNGKESSLFVPSLSLFSFGTSLCHFADRAGTRLTCSSVCPLYILVYVI